MLIDKISEYIHNSGRFSEQHKESFKKCVLIKAQNVANYLLQENEKEVFELDKDFPNVAPPWENYMIQWKFPKYTYSKEKGRIDAPNLNVEFATIVNDICNKEALHKFAKTADFEYKWAVNTTHFVSINDKLFFVGVAPFFIDKNGTVIVKNVGQDSCSIKMAPSGEIPTESSMEMCNEARLVYLMTTSFCHCKNVDKIKNYLDAPLIKKRKSQNKFPIEKFYTLEINPNKDVNKSINNESKGLWNNSLHICRGHFKTYTDKAPLFGKYCGTVWVPMHLKGNATQGTVHKDYDIHG